MVIVSIGENCLVDYYLKLLKVKNESFVFDNCRSNIEYVDQIIRSNFSKLIDKKYLFLKTVEKTRLVTKNNIYSVSNNIYCPYHVDGFEFTHHNLVDNINDYNSFMRKICRFRELLKSDMKIKFVYNYKFNQNYDKDCLIRLVNIFINNLATVYGNKFKIIVISQELLSDHSETLFTVENKSEYLQHIHVKSCALWLNDNWNGKTDEALLIELFKKYIL